MATTQLTEFINTISFIVIVLAIIILLINLRLMFAIFKLYNISQNTETIETKIKLIELDTSNIDEHIYELTLLQKEQNEIVQKILDKLEN